MGQQPNIEVAEEDRPRPVPEPGPSVRWRSNKPGVPSSPEDVPAFARTGPDPGWALKLIAATELPDPDPRLREVIIGLVLARAAAMGRAAIPEDIDAALVVCGFGELAGGDLVERRERWLAAVAHDMRPGQTAVAEVEPHVLVQKPEQIRHAYKLTGTGR